MSKKLLHILALFSFLNFGLNTQTSFAVEIENETKVSDIMSKNKLDKLFCEDLDELFDFNDIDDLLENDVEIRSPGFKEKLSLLREVLKGMPLKDKVSFISAILKSQIKEHKKKCIAAATALTASVIALIVLKNNKKDE